MLAQPGALVVDDELLPGRAAFGVLVLKEPVITVPAWASACGCPLLVPGGALRRIGALQRAGRDCARRRALQSAQQRRVCPQSALDLRRQRLLEVPMGLYPRM